MGYKYTIDGKKVVIIGSLNSKETIVQEVFVTDGTEFPAGEHFIVKTLLDVPAETYQTREAKKLEEYVKKLKADRDKLLNEISKFKLTQEAAASKIKWINGITDSEIERIFDNIKSFINGEYTHILYCEYGSITIEEWNADLFARYEKDYGHTKFDGIRLISLFGYWNKRLEMDWRVNQYRDGSGSGWHSFYPCKSYQEAILKAKEIIDTKDYLSDKDYETCIKYSIPMDEIKNTDRLKKKTDLIKRQIFEKKESLFKLENELIEVKKEKA